MIFIVANKRVFFGFFLTADAMQQCSLVARLQRNQYRLHVGMVAIATEGSNLLVGLPTTEAIRCTIQAEWLRNS
jgi:hypothetical protein